MAARAYVPAGSVKSAILPQFPFEDIRDTLAAKQMQFDQALEEADELSDAIPEGGLKTSKILAPMLKEQYNAALDGVHKRLEETGDASAANREIKRIARHLYGNPKYGVVKQDTDFKPTAMKMYLENPDAFFPGIDENTGEFIEYGPETLAWNHKDYAIAPFVDGQKEVGEYFDNVVERVIKSGGVDIEYTKEGVPLLRQGYTFEHLLQEQDFEESVDTYLDNFIPDRSTPWSSFFSKSNRLEKGAPLEGETRERVKKMLYDIASQRFYEKIDDQRKYTQLQANKGSAKDKPEILPSSDFIAVEGPVEDNLVDVTAEDIIGNYRAKDGAKDAYNNLYQETLAQEVSKNYASDEELFKEAVTILKPNLFIGGTHPTKNQILKWLVNPANHKDYYNNQSGTFNTILERNKDNPSIRVAHTQREIARRQAVVAENNFGRFLTETGLTYEEFVDTGADDIKLAYELPRNDYYDAVGRVSLPGFTTENGRSGIEEFLTEVFMPQALAEVNYLSDQTEGILAAENLTKAQKDALTQRAILARGGNSTERAERLAKIEAKKAAEYIIGKRGIGVGEFNKKLKKENTLKFSYRAFTPDPGSKEAVNYINTTRDLYVQNSAAFKSVGGEYSGHDVESPEFINSLPATPSLSKVKQDGAGNFYRDVLPTGDLTNRNDPDDNLSVDNDNKEDFQKEGGRVYYIRPTPKTRQFDMTAGMDPNGGSPISLLTMQGIFFSNDVLKRLEQEAGEDGRDIKLTKVVEAAATHFEGYDPSTIKHGFMPFHSMYVSPNLNANIYSRGDNVIDPNYDRLIEVSVGQPDLHYQARANKMYMRSFVEYLPEEETHAVEGVNMRFIYEGDYAKYNQNTIVQYPVKVRNGITYKLGYEIPGTKEVEHVTDHMGIKILKTYINDEGRRANFNLYLTEYLQGFDGVGNHEKLNADVSYAKVKIAEVLNPDTHRAHPTQLASDLFWLQTVISVYADMKKDGI